MQWLNARLAGCWDELNAGDIKLVVNNWVYIYYLELRSEALKRRKQRDG